MDRKLENGNKNARFARVGEYMDGLIHRERLAGCSILIHLGGEQVYEYYAGYADREQGRSLDSDTLFRIYSMTKPVTVTAALQLYEQGAFLLQDPVSQYLPEFKEMQVYERRADGEYVLRPAAQEIRIRDLFCMTSGLTYDGKGCPTEELTAQLLQEAYQNFEQRSCPTRELVRRIAGIPLAFEPGSRWHYGLSHDVLGGLVEVLSGQRFGSYVKEHICEPLGMKETFFHGREEQLSRLATVYTRRHDVLELCTDIFKENYTEASQCDSGGAGLISSLRDYMRFAEALTNGGTSGDGARILGKETVQLLRRDHLGSLRSFMDDWPALPGYSYGLGVRTMVDPAAGGANSSPGEFGWSGMAGSYVLMDPEKQLTVVYMQQLVPSTEADIHPRLRNIIYGCL